MKDPNGAIRHLLSRYEEAISTRDLPVLAELHWQDERFVATWSPGSTVRGWAPHADHLAGEFERMRSASFRFRDVSPEVFAGRFAVVCAQWRCESEWNDGRKEFAEGPATLVLAEMGTSWRIVASHFSDATR